MATETEIAEIQNACTHLQKLVDNADLSLTFEHGTVYLGDDIPCRLSDDSHKRKMESYFRATVKERQCGQPCFIEIEPHQSFGLEIDEYIVLEMEAGTSFEDAKGMAQKLNQLCGLIRIGCYR